MNVAGVLSLTPTQLEPRFKLNLKKWPYLQEEAPPDLLKLKLIGWLLQLIHRSEVLPLLLTTCKRTQTELLRFGLM